jgi:glycerophosphoryl diester phosphodiesterase
VSIFISHRGLADRFTENSMEAFREAVRAGFCFLETDLRMSLDGVIFLSHDDSLERVSDSKMKIHQTDSKEISRVRLNCGSPIAKLEDFLEEFRDQAWTLDIKEPLGEKVIHLLSQNKYLKAKDALRFVIWNPQHRNRLFEHFPQAVIYEDVKSCQKAAVGYLFKGMIFSPRPGATYSIISSMFGISFFERAFTDYFHRHGARILAFLPKDSDELQKAQEAEFDEILVDFRPSL